MRIVVIGGSGRIGSLLVDRLGRGGHAVLSASRSSGVDTVTGSGLGQALAGAEVAVDVINPPSSGGLAAPDFFMKSAGNIASAGLAAGLRHLVVLSVVGTDRLAEADYFRGKHLQETLAAQSGIPFTLVRATQFFEFIPAMAGAGTGSENPRVPVALIQPLAADDVASELVRISTGTPLGGAVELAGPEELPLADALRRVLAAAGDSRAVVADENARYFGVRIGERTLLPGPGSRIAPTRLKDWLAAQKGRMVGSGL